MAASPQFVVFDFDGVLADTVRPWYTIVLDELRACGVAASLDEMLSVHRGRLLDDVRADIERDHAVELPRGWTERVVARAVSEVGRNCQPIPGSVAVVRMLAGSGLPLAVASGSLRSAVADGVQRLGLADLLADWIVSSHDDGRHKPLPDVYVRACRLLNAEPSEGVAVEDSPTGVVSARAAGLTVIGFAMDCDPGQLVEAGAAAVIRDMRDLPGLLDLQV